MLRQGLSPAIPCSFSTQTNAGFDQKYGYVAINANFLVTGQDAPLGTQRPLIKTWYTPGSAADQGFSDGAPYLIELEASNIVLRNVNNLGAGIAKAVLYADLGGFLKIAVL